MRVENWKCKGRVHIFFDGAAWKKNEKNVHSHALKSLCRIFKSYRNGAESSNFHSRLPHAVLTYLEKIQVLLGLTNYACIW